ncbi:MAG: Hsp20/alpha crystallin family protein [Patescibacteria group bacterium]
MLNDDRSFFEKLTGSYTQQETPPADSALASFPEEVPQKLTGDSPAANTDAPIIPKDPADENNSDEGQLTVDVFQTPTHIVVQAPMAGVKPDDIDVSVNRDMITIRGTREQKQETDTHNYYYREVFWGPFSRSVLLPEEVDSDRTEASFKAGLLTIRLPKIDREENRSVKIEAKEI